MNDLRELNNYGLAVFNGYPELLDRARDSLDLLRHQLMRPPPPGALMVTFNNRYQEMDGRTIDENSSPEEVQQYMNDLLELWNFGVRSFQTRPDLLDRERQSIDSLYDAQVQTVPQNSEHNEEDYGEDLPEIIDPQSSVILERLLHYVANLENNEEIIQMDIDDGQQ